MGTLAHPEEVLAATHNNNAVDRRRSSRRRQSGCRRAANLLVVLGMNSGAFRVLLAWKDADAETVSELE